MLRDAVKEREALQTDFEYFAREVLKIRTKAGGILPLILNRTQKYVHQILEAQLKTLGKVRALILKGRQQGISTYVAARFFWKVVQFRGFRAFILTHEDEATKNLFEMTERFVSNSPLPVGVGKSNAKELFFPLLDSGYKVGTAGNKGTGRSGTIQYFHGSEVAQWPHADEHKAGVMQSLADMPDTESILESTAKGVGGMFHDMWKDPGEYIKVFLKWFWQDEYREAVPSGFRRTKEERQLVRIYQLDDMQLAWRRKKITELKPSEGGSPEDLFKQEYPCNDEEAFLFSGRLVFSAGHVQTARMECFNQKFRAEITVGKPLERPDGRLRVWKKPDPGKRYVIGADVAEGLVKGDFSSADVIEVGNGHQVAQWHGHIPPDQWGDVLFALGAYYNTALIGVERNNHGLTTLTRLKDKSYRRIYVQEDLEHRVDDKQTKKLGWLTTEKTKLKIIDQVAADLRDGTHGIFCEDTISEMTTYIIDENGKYTAKPGCFDDRVISYAIAREMLRHAPNQLLVAADSKTPPYLY